jgi:cell division septum initiation protein DivIVA
MAGDLSLSRIETAAVPAQLTQLQEENRRLREEVAELQRRVESHDKIMKSHELRSVVVFQLPTEFLKAKKKWVSAREFNIKLNEYAEIFWKLRQQFYHTLHRCAFKSRIGWILYENTDTTELELFIEKFNEVIEKLGVNGDRKIEVVEVLLPSYFVAEELQRYLRSIEEKLADVEEKLKRLSEDESANADKKASSLRSKKRSLEALLAACRHELARYNI